MKNKTIPTLLVLFSTTCIFGCQNKNTSSFSSQNSSVSSSLNSSTSSTSSSTSSSVSSNSSSSSSYSSSISSRESTSTSISSSNSSISTSTQNTGKTTCGHNHEIQCKTPANCVSRGYTTYICLDCGSKVIDDYVDKKSHDYSYQYVTYSSNRTYSIRNMCVTCGSTTTGNNVTLASNKVAFETAENLYSGNAMGFVISTNGNIKAMPALGYEFDKWSNGETKQELTEYTSDLVAIFKHKVGELPILSIDLANNATLNDVYRTEYKTATISVRNSTGDGDFKAGFKGRGNGSWVGPSGKSGYTFKFDSKQKLFGTMTSKSKKWNIIACKNDNSMHINYAAYDMAKTAMPGIEWQTETQFAEVFINKEFRGVYMVTDPVKVEKNRLPAVCENTSGDYDYSHQNPGFLIEYDRYATSNSSDGTYGGSGDLTPHENYSYFTVNNLYRDFTVKYPDPEDAVLYGGNIPDETFKQVVLKIKDVMNNFADFLKKGNYDGLEELVDINSMMDVYLVHELFKNSDVGWSSFFIYKKPNENKLRFGPVWDFDLAATYSRTNEVSGKHISTKTMSGSATNNTTSSYNDMFVMATKLKNTENKRVFADNLNLRFNSLKENIIKNICKTVGGNDNAYFAFGLNSKKWSIQDYSEMVGKELDWLLKRANWMLNNNFVY